LRSAKNVKESIAFAQAYADIQGAPSVGLACPDRGLKGRLALSASYRLYNTSGSKPSNRTRSHDRGRRYIAQVCGQGLPVFRVVIRLPVRIHRRMGVIVHLGFRALRYLATAIVAPGLHGDKQLVSLFHGPPADLKYQRRGGAPAPAPTGGAVNPTKAERVENSGQLPAARLPTASKNHPPENTMEARETRETGEKQPPWAQLGFFSFPRTALAE